MQLSVMPKRLCRGAAIQYSKLNSILPAAQRTCGGRGTMRLSGDSLPHAYAGIDVAFSSRKRLPISVAVHREGRLVPLRLHSRSGPQPPYGSGNRAALDPAALMAFAEAARNYLRAVEESEEVCIRTVAIDAPSAPRRADIKWRAAERALYDRGISCFATPAHAEFDNIVEEAKQHLASGGSLARLPNANRLWMLAGFALFEALGPEYECIEVFPHAIVAALGVSSERKATAAGLNARLDAVAQETGWPAERSDEPTLREIGYGSLHDKLDAYLSAWVASVPADRREACGEAPGDVIWIPRILPRAQPADSVDNGPAMLPCEPKYPAKPVATDP